MTVNFGAAAGATEQRVFLNFGEHGRELITTDVGLRVLHMLASGPEAAAREAGNPAAASALARTVFKIVPNENEGGRAKVEAGELCLRKNGRGVDTNRNWEVDWGVKEKDYDPYEEYPGTRPFSEPEAQLLRTQLAAFAPHAWVNVHSGMEAMFMPYDHKAEEASGPTGAGMRAVLEALAKTRCPRCVVGSGGGSVGYLAHGTATDHVFVKMGVPAAFTWEIYGDEAAGMDDCFKMFNPLERGLHDAVVATWAGACVDLPALLALQPSISGVNATASLPAGADASAAAAAAARLRGLGSSQAGVAVLQVRGTSRGPVALSQERGALAAPAPVHFSSGWGWGAAGGGALSVAGIGAMQRSGRLGRLRGVLLRSRLAGGEDSAVSKQTV